MARASVSRWLKMCFLMLQAHYCASHDVTIERWEAGSLFLGVTPEKANKSIRSVCQYLVNHFFEMYGVEVGVCLSVCQMIMALIIPILLAHIVNIHVHCIGDCDHCCV